MKWEGHDVHANGPAPVATNIETKTLDIDEQAIGKKNYHCRFYSSDGTFDIQILI
jgi:hypothetical protein